MAKASLIKANNSPKNEVKLIWVLQRRENRMKQEQGWKQVGQSSITLKWFER